jgi:hypothetical protein
VEGGADGIGSDLLQLTGYNGGEQGMLLICTFRLGGIPAPPMVLNHAVHADPEPARRQSPPWNEFNTVQAMPRSRLHCLCCRF